MPTLDKNTTVADKPVALADSFGSGRYSKHMKSAFEQLQSVFGLSEKVAKHIADAYGSELGAHMRRAEVDVTLGKINDKNNTISIKETSNLKGIVVTNNILAIRACAWVGEAFKNGIDYQETAWAPKPVLLEYFQQLDKNLNPVQQ